MATALEAPPVDTPRARRFRLAGILALAAVVAVLSWLSLHSRPAPDDPARVFDYVRDRVLAGDGGARWRMMSPPAREAYAKYVRVLAEPAANEGTMVDRDAWRRRVGLSKEDLRSLPPEKVMEKENLAFADQFFRGARVYEVEREEDRAYLRIQMPTGHEREWEVVRVDGAWRVENLWPSRPHKGVPGPSGGSVPTRDVVGDAPPGAPPR
jgi:hypothetical protein